MAQKHWVIYKGKGQMLLTGDKEEMWEEEREEEKERGRVFPQWAWKDRSVSHVLGYLGFAIQGHC